MTTYSEINLTTWPEPQSAEIVHLKKWFKKKNDEKDEWVFQVGGYSV